MESDKPDLNSILESARAQLEMYRRASQEDLNEPTKEIILTRSKDEVMEDVSGPLIDRAKETAAAGVDCVRAGSGKSVSSAEDSKLEKDSMTNSEMEDDGVEVEGEESSNKNFDSSTMTLGDQQSFQNQSELTSQTTYTNIHELTGPVKDDILVVTGPKTEQSEIIDSPSTVSHESQYESQTANLTTEMTTPTIEELNKIEDVPANQMASNRSWISDPCRESHQETIITETFPQEKTWDEAVDKSDAMKLAGAGTREGSPVRTSTKLIQEVAHRLSQLEAAGNQSPWLNQNFNEDGTECPRENNDVVSEESGSKNDENYEVRGRGYSIFDNPTTTLNFEATQPIENKEIDFVEHFNDKQMNKYDTGEGRVSDKSMLEDEGFVDSKDLLDTTKIIFISDQEDEQSCKPFETEDDASCMLEPSSMGRSLDVLSDLEAKPSLTDVHPIDQANMCENDEADAESNRFLSLETLQQSPDEEQNVGEEINYDLENANNDNNVDSQSAENPKEPGVTNAPKDTLTMIVETAPVCSKKNHHKNPSVINSSTTKNEPDKQINPKSNTNENKIDSNKQKKSHSPPQTSFSPRIVQCHNKSAEPSSDHDTPKKQNICMGRALFKMFYKSISEGKSPLPPQLTKVLQEAYANELPTITCTTTVPFKNDHTRFNPLVSDNLEEPCDLIIRPSLPITPLEQIEPIKLISNIIDLIEDTTIKNKRIVPEIIEETENDMNSQSQSVGVNKEHNETEPQQELIKLQRLIMPLSDLDNLLTDEFLGISRDTEETVVSEIFSQEITELKKSPKHGIKDSTSLSPETSVSANKKEEHSDIDSLPVSDISLSMTSAEPLFLTRHRIPQENSSDLSLRGERPLTPYVSDIRCPLPDISHYLQEPRIPAAIAPPPYIPQLHAQTTRPTNVESINPVTVKTPPRPPPRARHQTRPKKKKINFFKKLFGFNNK